MPNIWTANTVKFEPNEYDIVPDPRNPDAAFLVGNKAIEFRMSCAILKDGVFHHQYKEPHVPPPPPASDPNEDITVTVEKYKDRLIQNHLEHWRNAHAIVGLAGGDGKIALADVAAPVEKAKDQIDIDRESMQSAMQAYLKLTAQFNAAEAAGVKISIELADLDAAYAAWKQTMIHDEFWAFIPKDFPTR